MTKNPHAKTDVINKTSNDPNQQNLYNKVLIKLPW
jgi:hypothetical protein